MCSIYFEFLLGLYYFSLCSHSDSTPRSGASIRTSTTGTATHSSVTSFNVTDAMLAEICYVTYNEVPFFTAYILSTLI